MIVVIVVGDDAVFAEMRREEEGFQGLPVDRENR